MQYRFESSIGWPVPSVIAVPRDRVRRLVAYIPSVREIEELERTGSGRTLTLRRRWTLAPEVLPPGLRGLVPDEAVGFEDHLVFDGDSRAKFTITPLVHAGAFVCTGRLEVHDEGLDTGLEIDAVFSITDAGAARLPASVRSQGIPILESTIVSIIRAQLLQACRAIESLLDEEAG